VSLFPFQECPASRVALSKPDVSRYSSEEANHGLIPLVGEINGQGVFNKSILIYIVEQQSSPKA
jgi:hypothetical protein